jgi:virginiamycin B lyase
MTPVARLALAAAVAAAVPLHAQPTPASHASSAVLAQLPEGEFKRQFIIDCTNCHQLNATYAYPGGKAKTHAEWSATVNRMMSFAGANTGFPIMSPGRHADSTAAWLARYLTAPPTGEAELRHGTQVESGARITEYLLPEAQDLPHDIAVDSTGQLLVTGMMTHTLYLLDTASRVFTPVAIPQPRANPRAVEIARNGDWWVLLGGPGKVARYSPLTQQWTMHDVGMYAHSIAIDGADRVWFNGHFTRDPEQIGYVDARTGSVRVIPTPPHPTLRSIPGGPIPYELRVAGNGVVWMSELQGHRMLSYDPRTEAFRTFDMPVSVSAPRRFEIDSGGALWIPSYAANALVRLDPATGRTTAYDLPRKDAAPYVVKVAGATIWIGTNASDEVYAFDTRSRQFRVYPLPTRGAVIRHMVVDPRNGDLWLAYGASPGIPARIARLRVGGGNGARGGNQQEQRLNTETRSHGGTATANRRLPQLRDSVVGWFFSTR